MTARTILHVMMNILMSVSSESAGGESGAVRTKDGRTADGSGVAGGRPSPERDLHLVERARNGDREAFRQLVVAYQERIFIIIRGMVRNQEDARDIAQDVFIKAYSSLDSFRGQSSFYTWLYRIAVNMTIDFRRKMDRKQESAYDDRIEPDSVEGAIVPGSTQYSPHRAYLGKELGINIRRAMDSLPPDQRTAIVLRELEGLSYKEIADIMECSQGTVMSRLFYGRKKLQEYLKDFL